MRKIGILLLIIALIPVSFADQIFFDLEDHWAMPAIHWAVDQGYVNGYEDGTFRPEQGITRMEFLAIYQEILKKNGVFSKDYPAVELPYEDILDDDWGRGLIELSEANLSKKGLSLVDVFPGTSFDGERPILRQEAITLIAWTMPDHHDNQSVEFTDLIQPDLQEMVEHVVAEGIFMGYPDQTIRLESGLSRAEATIVLQRLAVKMEIFKDSATAELLIPTTIYDNAFLSFGQYADRAEKDADGKLTDDGRYLRVMRTLEYLSFDQQIPFSEKKLYDEQPVSTLVSLRTGEYWNRIGVDYYLLQAAPFSEQEKEMLAEEMFMNYMIRNDLSFMETKQLFQQFGSKISDLSLIENVFAFWSTQIASPEERFTLYSMQAKEYLARGYAVEARIGYEWMRSKMPGVGEGEYWIFSDMELQRMFLANLIYLDDQINGTESVRNLLSRMRSELEISEMTESEKINANALVDELENRYHWEKIKVLP